MNNDIKSLEEKIAHNQKKIETNAEKIHQNTGALEILKTFKADSQRFFVMWLITFICLMCSLGIIMFLLHK